MTRVASPSLEYRQLGRYQLLERLAAGGMAEIFKARTLGAHGFEKTLVIKRLLSHLAEDPHFVEMFVDEARVMMQLNHPKIVQVIDFGEVAGEYFIAMEYIDGLDLLAVLRRCALRNCRPSVEIAVHVVAEVLDALDYAHTLRGPDGRPLGIVHRDISPSNIFLSRMGEVKLGDFGIATAADQRAHSEPGALRGKFGYLAPENVSGAPVDCRADLFSLGVVFAELLTVRRLFVGNSDLEVLLKVRDARLDRLQERIDRIPVDVRPILASALSREPDTRYQDAASFRDALHRYLFDNRRMVHRTDVRRFLEQLTSDQTPLHGLTRMPPSAGPDALAPSAPPPQRPPGAGRTDDLTPVVSTVDLDIGDGELRSIPSIVGKKRKVVLAPPPRSAPLPDEARQTREAPSLSTDELLAVAPEPKQTSSFVDLNSALGHAPPVLAVDATVVPEKLPPAPHELRAFLARRMASQSEWSSTVRPTMRGTLQDESLFSVLFRLAVGEETGLLVIRSADALKEIYLVDGDPYYVISDKADELFGQYLVDKGIISEGELAMALAALPQFGGKLGDAMVAMKLLTALQVMRHLTRQVRQKVLNAFEWESGGFAYYAGKACEHEGAPLGLDAFEVLGAGVEALPPAIIERRLAPLLEQRPRAAPDAPVPPEVFRLGNRPRGVFDKLDGRLTLGEHLARFDDAAEREEFSRMTYLLMQTELVRTRSRNPTHPWGAGHHGG